MTPSELLSERTKRHITQAHLASIFGVNPRTVIRWEKGTSAIPDQVAAWFGASSAPVAVHKAKYIADDNREHRHLYYRATSRFWARSPLHPGHLLSPVDLAPFLDAQGRVDARVLESDAYLAALARYRASEAPKASGPSFAELIEQGKEGEAFALVNKGD